MLVSDILKAKGSAVIGAAPGATVAEAAALLTEKRIGAVVILEDGRLAGILSERDIVRTLAKEGPGCLAGPVARLMTAKVLTCTPAHSIAEVMEIMTNSRIRHLPVMEGERLAGMVSIGDVVKWRLEEAQEELRQLSAYVAGAA
jgi:CBS domain-containing protein